MLAALIVSSPLVHLFPRSDVIDLIETVNAIVLN